MSDESPIIDPATGLPYCRPPNPPQQLVEFFAWETVGCGMEREQPEKLAMQKKLYGNADVARYRKGNGASYVAPGTTGTTVIEVLPQLKGLPLCDLVLAYVHGLEPSIIRISDDGCVCTDAWSRRVTIHTKDDLVERIEQEFPVGYSCGAEIDTALRTLREKFPRKAVSYLVYGTCEAYADASQWEVAVFSTEERAKLLTDKLNAHCVQVRKHEIDPKAPCPGDPGFCWCGKEVGYGGTEYNYIPVPLDVNIPD